MRSFSSKDLDKRFFLTEFPTKKDNLKLKIANVRVIESSTLATDWRAIVQHSPVGNSVAI